MGGLSPQLPPPAFGSPGTDLPPPSHLPRVWLQVQSHVGSGSSLGEGWCLGTGCAYGSAPSEIWEQVILSLQSPHSTSPALCPPAIFSQPWGVGNREVSRCLEVPVLLSGFMWGHRAQAAWSGQNSGKSELWLSRPRGASRGEGHPSPCMADSRWLRRHRKPPGLQPSLPTCLFPSTPGPPSISPLPRSRCGLTLASNL